MDLGLDSILVKTYEPRPKFYVGKSLATLPLVLTRLDKNNQAQGMST